MKKENRRSGSLPETLSVSEMSRGQSEARGDPDKNVSPAPSGAHGSLTYAPPAFPGAAGDYL